MYISGFLLCIIRLKCCPWHGTTHVKGWCRIRAADCRVGIHGCWSALAGCSSSFSSHSVVDSRHAWSCSIETRTCCTVSCSIAHKSWLYHTLFICWEHTDDSDWSLLMRIVLECTALRRRRSRSTNNAKVNLASCQAFQRPGTAELDQSVSDMWKLI